jgi:hypothetical protein
MSTAAASTRTQRWDLLILWAYLISLAAIRAGHIDERDPYWQIRAGMENLTGVPLARPDTWSWSGVEGNWYPNSPLWNMLLALSYQAGGFWGFFLLSATSIVLLGVIVHLLARRLGARPLPGLLGLLVVAAAAYPMLSARATTLVQVLLLVAVYVALRISDRASSAPVGLLAGLTFVTAVALSTLGNWIHLSFLLLAPALALVWAAIWMLTPGLGAGRRWTLIGLGAFGWMFGVALSPYGLLLGVARMRAVRAACQGLLVEWGSPLSPYAPRQSLFMLVIALLLTGGSGWLLYRRWRAGGPVRELVALTLIGVPAALAGTGAIRFLGVALLTLAPIASVAATRASDVLRVRLGAWPTRERLRERLCDYSSGRFWRIVLTASLVVLIPGTVVLAAQHGEPAEAGVLARLPSGCHLFSRPGIGSVAVLLRPDVPVWMDGRADFFGRGMLLQAYSYYGGDSAAPVPDGTTCVIVDLGTDATPALGQRLKASPSWRLDAAEGNYELWLPSA